MITGIVNSDYEPIVNITVWDINGKPYKLDAIIDTCFDGWLSLPPEFIATLGFPWKRRGRAILADGSESIFDVYEAVLIWDGEHRTIPIDEADSDPLIGMSLMEGYELTIQAIEGGKVTLVKLSNPNSQFQLL